MWETRFFLIAAAERIFQSIRGVLCHAANQHFSLLFPTAPIKMVVMTDQAHTFGTIFFWFHIAIKIQESAFTKKGAEIPGNASWQLEIILAIQLLLITSVQLQFGFASITIVYPIPIITASLLFLIASVFF